MVERKVTANGLVADFFHDGSGQPRSGIIILGGSEGGKFWSRQKRLLQALVDRKYSVLSLAYFKAPGLPRSLEEIPLEYFEKAFEWLAEQPESVPGRLALVGASKGAEAALLLGSRYPVVKAVVALGPSSVVWRGIPRNPLDLRKVGVSSWSYRGEGLPCVSPTYTLRQMPAVLILRLRKSGEKALQNSKVVGEASIPVENIQGPILLISGQRDQLWPATAMSEQMVARLTGADFPYHYEHIAYDKGHVGIVRDKSIWRTVFEFLDKHYLASTNDLSYDARIATPSQPG